MNNELKRRIYTRIMLFLAYLATVMTVFVVGFIIVYVFVRAIPHFSWQLLTSKPSYINETIGVLPDILNTIYMVALTLLIAAPIGIGSAIYLNEYAKAGKIVKIIQFTTETLSGIPSIIFGLFGMVFFGTTLGFGYSILTGSLTLTIMVLPLITRNTQEALKTVPDSYRSGALGMGATKWYMIRTILLPSALPGIVTGVILAIGRIVGESAALLFTAGSGFLLPRTAEGFLTKIMEPGGTLTIQLYLSMTKGQYDVAFGIATVLLVIVLAINIFTKILASRLDVNRRK